MSCQKDLKAPYILSSVELISLAPHQKIVVPVEISSTLTNNDRTKDVVIDGPILSPSFAEPIPFQIPVRLKYAAMDVHIF